MSEKETEREKEDNPSDLKLSLHLGEILAKLQEIELEDFEMEVGDLEISFQNDAVVPQAIWESEVALLAKSKPQTIMRTEFVLPVTSYPGQIVEVKLGATSASGGTRAKSIVIGGETTPAFYTFEKPTLHAPVVALDVFDMEIPLPRAVKMHVKEVIGDPAAWAKLAVDRFGADLLTIHLISIVPS